MPMLTRFLISILLVWAGAAQAQDEEFLKDPSAGGAAAAAKGGRKQKVLSRTETKKTAARDEELPKSEIRNRGIFRIREVRTESDWDCDPTAIPAWCRQFHMRVGLNTKWMNPRQPVNLDSEEIFEMPILYMTGHTAFTFSDVEVKNLRRYLLNGGALWVDDCLFGFPFGRSFKSEIKRVLPETGFEPVLPGQKGLDSLFGIHYQIRTTEAGVPESGMGYYKQGSPVQVIRVDGCVAVVYTAFDLGCYAEISSPPTAANPIGGPMHSMYQPEREGSYRLCTNLVLYLLTH
ncbi:MAG: DUF4159 domain-containing protein [Planctomycetes bacterium]|nr:DUF4159 domain-containing protein [Planctomycetota bacterium]